MAASVLQRWPDKAACLLPRSMRCIQPLFSHHPALPPKVAGSLEYDSSSGTISVEAPLMEAPEQVLTARR